MCRLYVPVYILSLILILGANAEQDCQGKCQVAYKCSSEENIVWATDGADCYVETNECQLNNRNCQRENNCEDVLKIITKDECQKMCKDFCTEEYAPLCAYYKDTNKTFSNKCVLENHICSSGEPWKVFSAGECESSSS